MITTRIADLTLCVLLLPILVLLGPPLWVAGRIGGYESLFFRQTRVGFRERPFTVLKFRTLKASSRPTPVDGLFRMLRRLGLDEIPQILCIGAGRMSWVGPRPLVPSELYFEPAGGLPRARQLVQLRQSVMPGLTGPSQLISAARQRDASTDRALFDLDLWYVRSRSVALDLKLVLRTFMFVATLGHRIGTVEPGAGYLAAWTAARVQRASAASGDRRL